MNFRHIKHVHLKALFLLLSMKPSQAIASMLSSTMLSTITSAISAVSEANY